MPKCIFRSVEIDGEVDVASGVIRLSFASELPVLRTDDDGKKYWEVLSHDPGDTNLGLINREGVLLANHDEKTQIGEVVRGSVRVEADKKTRADIKITDEVWKERISRGERPGVSVGGIRLSVLSETADKDGIPIIRFAWSPYEISLLDGNAADKTVGLFRSEVDSKTKVTVEELITNLTPDQIKRMKILLDPTPAGGGGATITDPAIERAAIQTAERKRVGDITRIADTMAKDHGTRNSGKFADDIRRMAQEAVEKGSEARDFRADVLEATMKAQEADTVSLKSLGVKRGEYSLGRAIRSCIARSSKTPDGLEGEVHAEMLKRDIGVNAGGFLLPFDAETAPDNTRNRTQRDLQATVFNTGGAMVPTQLMVPPIELLRNRLVTSTLGVRMLSGLTGGNVVIPRQIAPATAAYATEIAALTASNLLLDQIAMQPHRVGVQTLYSKQLLLQSAGSVENLIYDDAFQVMALIMDLGALAGSGAASQPLGILNTPGIGSVTFGATATYAKILAFENSLDIANADSDASAWVVTPAVKNAWKGLAVTLTGATTVIGGPANALWVGKGRDGEVAGYRAASSNQMPSNLALFGDFSSCMMAMWGGFDVVLDPYTKAGNAEYVLTINAWYDIAIRHPQKFCASADSANQ